MPSLVANDRPRAATDSRFRLGETQARDLAARFGTPLYVVDETHLRARIAAYRDAFAAAWPHPELTFAAKANSTLALLRIAYEEGCRIDAASEGELRAALAAGVPAGACELHGNNKGEGEILFAVESGVAQIVADHMAELDLISKTLKANPGAPTKIVLRLAPGVDPVTHAKISTGQSDTKFGFNIADGSADRALARALELGLPVIGFHCHVGSQLLDPEAQRSGGALIAEFARRAEEAHGFRASYLNVGGGLGVRYTDADDPMPVAEYNRLVADAVREALGRDDLTLGQEPGRSLVAESGVTLYTVGVVKTVPTKNGTRTYAAVDGGLSDNPRPALYGSKYAVERVARADTWTYATDGPGAVHSEPPAEDALFTVSGRHCETDRLFEDAPLPADLARGDLLQVLCTGAYNASMASNYNRYPRPAVALVGRDGEPRLVARRDTYDEMFARETL